MRDILDMDGWTLTDKRTEEGVETFSAEYLHEPRACTKCGGMSLYRHGTKDTIYRDSPILGHATRILARVQRYKCRECGETFLQPLAGIQEDRRMTARCAEYIKEQCLRDTFTSIADHVGCDDKTVRNLAGEYIATLDAAYKPPLPAWLGIDETQIDGKMRCVLTDIGARWRAEAYISAQRFFAGDTDTAWTAGLRQRYTLATNWARVSESCTSWRRLRQSTQAARPVPASRANSAAFISCVLKSLRAFTSDATCAK